jgi:hypothetical protein
VQNTRGWDSPARFVVITRRLVLLSLHGRHELTQNQGIVGHVLGAGRRTVAVVHPWSCAARGYIVIK